MVSRWVLFYTVGMSRSRHHGCLPNCRVCRLDSKAEKKARTRKAPLEDGELVGVYDLTPEQEESIRLGLEDVAAGRVYSWPEFMALCEERRRRG